MENIFEKHQKILEEALKNRQEMEKKASENPEKFPKELGIDPNNYGTPHVLSNSWGIYQEILKGLE